jgi:trans-aconitate methyltransferase
MQASVKKIIIESTPPALFKAAKKAFAILSKRRLLGYKYGVEQPADFYDKTFELNKGYRQHYTESHYYPIWAVIMDRIKSINNPSIIDIGCGPGQFACMMRDYGVQNYTGVDFSTSRIAHAKTICPDFSFYKVDIFEDRSLLNIKYDCAIILEFLEHVEDDLTILKKIKTGTKVLATVPNFPAQGHVRYFSDEGEVLSRYSSLFENLKVSRVIANSSGKCFFLFEGDR